MTTCTHSAQHMQCGCGRAEVCGGLVRAGGVGRVSGCMRKRTGEAHPRLGGTLLLVLTASIFQGRKADERHPLHRCHLPLRTSTTSHRQRSSKVGTSMGTYALATTRRLEHGQLASFPQRRGRASPAEAVDKHSIGRLNDVCVNRVVGIRYNPLVYSDTGAALLHISWGCPARASLPPGDSPRGGHIEGETLALCMSWAFPV